MSFCHECGEALVQGWAYCEGCGAKLPEPVLETASARPTRRQPLTAEPLARAAEAGGGPEVDVPSIADALIIPVEAPMAGDPITPIEVPVMAEAPIMPADIESMLGFAWTNTLTVPESDVLPEATAATDMTEVTVEPAVSPAQDAPPKRDRRRLAVVATGVVAIVALVAVTTLHIVGTHDRLNRTRDTLAATESDLSDTRADLDAEKKELASTEASLTTRTSERNEARADLADAQAQLGTTTSALNDARGKVDLQASQIEDLRTCLVGVMNALLYVTDEYYMAAVEALDAVEFECDRAADSII